MITILLIFFLIIAVLFDLKSYKIKNKLILISIIFGVLFRIYPLEWSYIFDGAISFVLPFLILLPLYLFGALGAGDIKLFMIIGLYQGFNFTKSAILYSFFIGGVISIVYLIRSNTRRARVQYLIHYLKYVVLKLITKQISTIEPYYNLTEDGQNGVIHYSIPILLSVVYCVIKA